MTSLSKIAASFLLLSAIYAQPTPRVRAFHFDYKATVKDIPAGAHHVDLWVPVPQSNQWQRVENLKVDSPYPYGIATTPAGNTMLHVAIDHPKERTLSVNISLDASRKEHIQYRLTSGTRLAHDESPQELSPYLKSERLVPINGQIRSWAQEVVDKAGAHTDLEKARAIYNHIIATVRYDKTGKGWGRGDIYYACEARRGNCTDFHAIFIGYCRALGIPARFAIGFPLPADRGAGRIAGYHCWAEFYAKGIGWVPVDASEGEKNPSKRAYFFGAHDENRIELSKGRDVMLTPPQKGAPLNYFVNPYAEMDSQPFAGTEPTVSYRDLAVSPQVAALFHH